MASVEHEAVLRELKALLGEPESELDRLALECEVAKELGLSEVGVELEYLRTALAVVAASELPHFIVQKPVVVCLLNRGEQSPYDSVPVGIARCNPVDIEEGLWDPVVGMLLAYRRALCARHGRDHQRGRSTNYWQGQKHGRQIYANQLAGWWSRVFGQDCMVDVVK
jgi:hypothetical protein